MADLTGVPTTTQATSGQTIPTAPSLFQKVQANLQSMAAPQSAGAGVLGSTGLVQRVSQAATGRVSATGEEGPQRDVQQELAAIDQVQQGQQAIARDSQLTQLSQQQADQQMQNEYSLNSRKLDENSLNQLAQYNQTQNRILNEYSTQQRQLDLNKDKAKMEQLGFSLRLSDAKYLDQLNREATKARLSDAVQFNEELARTVFGQEQDLLRSNLSFRAMLNADDNQFKLSLQQIDASMALDLAMSQNRAMSEGMMWQGVATASSGLAQFGASDTGKKWLNNLFSSNEEIVPSGGTADVSGINPGEEMA